MEIRKLVGAHAHALVRALWGIMSILFFFDGINNEKFVMIVLGVVLASGYALCDLTSFERRALKVFFVLLEGFFVLLAFGTVVARAMAIL